MDAAALTVRWIQRHVSRIYISRFLSRIEQWQGLQGETRVLEIVSASKEITFFNITKQGKIYNQTKIMRLQNGM
ncbi:MAG: hypothetical protein ACTHJP_05650 [Rhodanobacteraceae bacterium]